MSCPGYAQSGTEENKSQHEPDNDQLQDETKRGEINIWNIFLKNPKFNV